jgi:hypothetical protein
MKAEYHKSSPWWLFSDPEDLLAADEKRLCDHSVVNFMRNTAKNGFIHRSIYRLIFKFKHNNNGVFTKINNAGSIN